MIMIMAQIASLGGGLFRKKIPCIFDDLQMYIHDSQATHDPYVHESPAFPNTIVMAKVTGWFLHNSVVGMMVVRLGD